MKKIVVGYDGSDAAHASLEWVADRLRTQQAAVELVTITGTMPDDELVDATLSRAAMDLTEAVPGTEVHTRLREGRMPEALVDEAKAADLLVVGVRRKHRLRAALTGWMPLRIGAHARGPVMIVPEGWMPSDLPVTVGVDDDNSSDHALMRAAAEATAAGVPLRMVHGWEMPLPTIDGTVALLVSPIEVKETHRRILADAAQRVADAYPELGIEEVLVPGPAGAALVERAPQSSLLVLGTHHRGVLAGGVLGSVAQDVLWRTACAVCIVPNPRDAETARDATAHTDAAHTDAVADAATERV